MNNGFKNERDFVELFNNKYLHELDDRSIIFLKELFGGVIDDEEIIVSWKNKMVQKADIFIKYKNYVKSVSLKCGNNNSIHQEQVQEFKKYLSDIGVPYKVADQYYMRNHHEPIIKREDFEKVQEIIKNRVGARATGRRLGNIGRKYTFSGKIKCGFCGNTYVRRAMYSKQGSTCIWDCLLNIRSGKESCENSKAMRENLLENVFVDAFQRLCNNQNMDKDQLIKIITSALRDDRNIEKVKSLEKEKINIEYQQQRLIDLMIDGTIDKESYNKKKITFDNKKEKIDKEIEQYRLLTEDEDKVELGIKKIKEVIDSNKLLDGFDRDVFDALVDYIIIGGYENGKKDDCMIRFICKTQFEDTPREDLTKQKIIDNNDIMDYKCYSFINILDFYSNQQFFYFYVDENGKKRKKVINSVRVRVEVEK